MTPADMTQRLRHLHVEGDDLVARFTEKSPEAVEALRAVKHAVLTLNQAADLSGCAEPLHILAHEFRYDLKQMTAGTWSVETIAEAIRMIGPGYRWQFERRDTA